MCDSTHCDPGDENDYRNEPLSLREDFIHGEIDEPLKDDELRNRANFAAFVNGTSFAEEVENLRRLAERNYKADPDPEWPTEKELFEMRSSAWYSEERLPR